MISVLTKYIDSEGIAVLPKKATKKPEPIDTTCSRF